MATPRPPKSKFSAPAPDPTPDVVDGPEASDADNATIPVDPHAVADIADVTNTEFTPAEEALKPSEDELVQLQKEAEEDTPAKAAVEPGMHEVRFSVSHTYGNRVYDVGETAQVPVDHPYYGMSPQEQEDKYGRIHFVLVDPHILN